MLTVQNECNIAIRITGVVKDKEHADEFYRTLIKDSGIETLGSVGIESRYVETAPCIEPGDGSENS